jgi:hypothetical protein
MHLDVVSGIMKVAAIALALGMGLGAFADSPSYRTNGVSEGLITVFVIGEVKNPGKRLVPQGCTVDDLVKTVEVTPFTYWKRLRVWRHKDGKQTDIALVCKPPDSSKKGKRFFLQDQGVVRLRACSCDFPMPPMPTNNFYRVEESQKENSQQGTGG